MKIRNSMVIAGIVSLISAPARADVQTLGLNPELVIAAASGQSQAASDFERLKQDFEQGTLPTRAEVTGWYSGRCFRPSSPDTPIGALMLGEEVTHTANPNAGPLFPPTQSQTFRLASIVGEESDDAPDRFDNLSDSHRASVSAFMQSTDFQSLVTVERDGSYETSYETQDGSLLFRFRKLGDYLIDKNTVAQDQSPFHAGDIYMMCYFFKKVN